MDNNGNPPDKPGGSNNGSSNVSYSGATVISDSKDVSSGSFTSSKGAENALLISGGDVSFDNIEVTKTGDDSGDEADFYGTNAAVFAYNNAGVTIANSTVTTDGTHANAVFAYGEAIITIEDTSITTSADNSGGIMVTGGGTISAKNLSVITSGRSSAAIRSDRGGGTIKVEDGVYTTEGVGSPAIYSTADINVSGALLRSTASEGIVIEGKNSVTLEHVTLDATNSKLNGQSETYKSIFIYQSMSGDASEGTGKFTANNNIIFSHQGDVFFITNTTAEISLYGNKIVQSDTSGAFLRAQAGAWGNSGSNGGKVTLAADTQEILGDIIADAVSSINLNMTKSYFAGTFSGDGTINLAVSEDSIVVLTGDSYVASLSTGAANNSNIYANGHTLYVDGEKASINQDTAPESFLSGNCTADLANCIGGDEMIEVDTTDTTETESQPSFPVWGYFAIVLGALVLFAIIATIILKVRGKDNNPKPPTPSTQPPTQPPYNNFPRI